MNDLHYGDSMFKNYLIVALRNLINQKIYTCINIFGLAIGIACCVVIFLFVQDEFQYDGHHVNKNEIYRVLWQSQLPGQQVRFRNTTPGALGPVLKADFSDVLDAVRIFKRRTWITIDNKTFEPEVCLADPNIFNVFTYPFVQGDENSLLTTPYSIVVTESMAKNYWGMDDPIGKTMVIDQGFFQGIYTVTGVLKDVPRTTTYGLRFDCLTTTVSPNMETMWNNWHQQSQWRYIWTYVLMPKEKPVVAIEEQMAGFATRYLGQEIGQFNTYTFQPLSRVHLYSKVDYGMYSDGNIDLVYILMGVAIFVLLIACFNFMNLATARSTNRAKEIGMRKVVGAQRVQLIRQFLGESILLSFIGLIFAIMLVEFLLPVFNDFARTDGLSKNLALNFSGNWMLVFGLLGIGLFVGILSGSYPAFFLSSFHPIEVIKGRSNTNIDGGKIRKGLVVFQFTMAILFLIGVMVVHKQLDFIFDKGLGYNKTHLVQIPIFDRDRSLVERVETVRQAFLQHPNILKASTYSTDIVWGGRIENMRPEGVLDERWPMRLMGVDDYFLETFEIALLEGQNFSEGYKSGFILNEAAVKVLGWTDPIGKQLEWVSRNRKGTVIGVVKDFHNRPLYEAIGPVALYMRPKMFTGFTVRVHGDQMAETLTFLEQTWKQFVPHISFKYAFLEARLEQEYRSEIRLKHILSVASILAILVACLGLFGLTAFLAEQRTREIGIRRVLGASCFQVFRLLSGAFLKPIFWASMFACPIAYFVTDYWLQNFVYRINLDIIPFAFSGICVMVISLGTVLFQAIRTARRNPVDTLKHDG